MTWDPYTTMKCRSGGRWRVAKPLRVRLSTRDSVMLLRPIFFIPRVWHTIAGQHNDPPTRAHVRPIASYRRAYPEREAGRRPLTPRGPVWGGDHASLAVA